MRIYLRGVILSVGQIEVVGQNQVSIQHCVIQHEFNLNDAKYNKYATFEVFGEERIKQLALKPQEEVELAIDLNARQGSMGHWFNSLTAYGVERDKKKWHYYQDNRQRVAVPPTTHPLPKGRGETPADVAGTMANTAADATGTAAMPTEQDDEIPF